MSELAEYASLAEVATVLRMQRSTVAKMESRALRRLWQSQVRTIKRSQGSGRKAKP